MTQVHVYICGKCKGPFIVLNTPLLFVCGAFRFEDICLTCSRKNTLNIQFYLWEGNPPNFDVLFQLWLTAEHVVNFS